MRGRKKIKDPNCAVFSIRVTKKQKEILIKNDWIKKEIIQEIRKRLEIFTFD